MKVGRKHCHFILALAFNVLLFWVLFHWFATHIHWNALVKDIHHTTDFSIFLVLLFYGVNIFIASMRFAKLLDCPLSKSTVLVCLAYGLNNLLPFRAGDILRLYFAKRFFDIDISRTFTATFMARYLDLVVLLFFGGILVMSTKIANDTYVVYLFSTLLGFSVLAVFLYRVLILRPGALSQFCRKSSFIQKMLETLEWVVAQPHKTRLLLMSLLLWFTVLGVYYSFFKINLPAHLFTIDEAILLLFTTTLCFAIPYSFAGMGVFEVAIIYCLVKFVGIATTQALALAIAFHVVVALPQIVLMSMVLLRYRKSIMPAAILSRTQ